MNMMVRNTERNMTIWKSIWKSKIHDVHKIARISILKTWMRISYEHTMQCTEWRWEKNTMKRREKNNTMLFN